MGREVRMVPADWEHPQSRRGTEGYQPLFDNYAEALDQFDSDIKEMGLGKAIDYHGGGPVTDDYMLVGVPAEKRTHYMMYEDTTEGTPLSPAFSTPEELARYLADSGASSFGSSTASYEAWLATIQAGYAPSALMSPGLGIISGVEGMHKMSEGGGQ